MRTVQHERARVFTARASWPRDPRTISALALVRGTDRRESDGMRLDPALSQSFPHSWQMARWQPLDRAKSRPPRSLVGHLCPRRKVNLSCLGLRCCPVQRLCDTRTRPANSLAERPCPIGRASRVRIARLHCPVQRPCGTRQQLGNGLAVTPRPVSYSTPNLNCASALPCSAALRYQSTACA